MVGIAVGWRAPARSLVFMLYYFMRLHDVIVAVASPPGRSLRGIIRISGARSLDLIRQVINLHHEAASVERPATIRAASGAIREEDGGHGHPMHPLLRGHHHAQLQFLIDRRLTLSLLAFPAPHSYTGEDSIELQMPGNPALLEQSIDSILAVAAHHNIEVRRAEPGEFTARAFFNGRLSLTQAEGVAATIAAQSDAELRAAQWLSSGSLGAFAHALADDLVSTLALVEAGIDFTDQEDVVAISPVDLLNRLHILYRRIRDQLSRAVGTEQLRAIPWVVLRGRPNAGKSALFNALLGHERAVVSPTAGTTRDVLAEPLIIDTPHGPGEVMLVDLAGLDADEDSTINRLMQAAATEAAWRAELVLRCVPVNQAVGDIHVIEQELLVRTKCDLTQASADDGISVSAVSREGLDALRRAIADRLADRAVSLAADATVLRPRHEAALRSALNNLGEAVGLVEPLVRERTASLPNPELIAAAMRVALDDLSALAGDITPDDVLGRVFSTFCVGK